MAAIGLFGGTFNPVHIGHMILAQDACEACSLSRVLFVPCATPPHKATTGLLEDRHRVAMLKRAIAGDERFELEECELERQGVSYSIDTVRTLRERFPDDELVFIIGTDSLVELHLWREIESLLDLCTFVAVPRPGVLRESLRVESIQLPAPWPERLLGQVIEGNPVDISSTRIRKRIAEGRGCRYLVPDEVRAYIKENGLYTP